MSRQFRRNCTYRLIEATKDNFYYNTSSNPGIMRELEEHGGSFTVLELNESYRPTKVVFADGLVHNIIESGSERGMLFYLFADEIMYFEKVRDKTWKVGRSYVCTNPEALIENSSMNERLIALVGNRPFEVLKMMTALGAPDTRTQKIRFSDEGTGEPVEMNFTLTQAERSFFKEVDSDYEVPVDNDLGVSDEYPDPVNEDEAGEEQAESPEKEFAVHIVQGLMRFEIDDEMTRLKAIEVLKTLRFEK